MYRGLSKDKEIEKKMVKIINEKSAYYGMIGYVVEEFRGGTILVGGLDRFDMNFYNGEYERLN